MKAEITEFGNLFLERNGKMVEQWCPYKDEMPCGYWCPKFQVGQEEETKLDCVHICRTEVYVELVDNFNMEVKDDD